MPIPFSRRGMHPLAGWLLIYALVVSSLVAPPPAAAATLSVATTDGLKLSLNTNGTVAGITASGRALPKLANGGGFSLRGAGGAPNLLPNPGFEKDSDGNGVPDGWTRVSGGSVARIGSVARSGSRSVALYNPSTATSGAFSVSVPVKAGTNYVVSAWFRSENVLPTASVVASPDAAGEGRSPLRIRVDETYNSGMVKTSYAYGYTNTASWNRQFVGFRTSGGIRTVRVTPIIEGGSGKAWIDDLYLGELLQATPTTVGGSVSAQSDGSVRQRASLSSHGLALDAVYRGAQNHIRVDGTVTNTGTADKGFQLTYTLPLNAAGWRWGEYVRQSTPIVSGAAYSREARSGLQRTSVYPYSTVYDSRSALSLGMPLRDPRIARIRYEPTGLSITLDLGVSRAATQLGNRATFSFLIFTSPPAWGFRASTEKYYKIQPTAFQRRTAAAREGIWYFVADRTKLEDKYKQLGLGLNTVALGKSANQRYYDWGRDYLEWNQQRGIYSSAYNHHWAFYMPSTWSALPTYDQVISRLKSDATSGTHPDDSARYREEARAALESTARDYNGRLYYEPFRGRLAFYQNVTPRPSAPTDWPRAIQKHQVERALTMASGVGTLNGIHLDSTAGMQRWGAAEDYDTRHWAQASSPLTFSYHSGHVTQLGITAMHDHMRKIASFVHGRGMFLSSNFNASEPRSGGYFGASEVDYVGIEGGLPDRCCYNAPFSLDSFAMLRRTLAYQRPITTIDYRIDDGSLTAAQVEDRVEQAVFYGIYSGVSGGTKDWPDNPRLASYGKYTPALRALGVAGWEPVTNAHSSNGNVWIERYGAVSSGDLNLAVRNETGAAQSYTLTIELNKDGVSRVQSVSASERITGTSLRTSLDSTGTRATISTSIPARSTRVIRVATR